MAFKMKGFSGFGNSPVKQRKKYTKKDYDFLKKQREERVKSIDYLTKTPTGPRANKRTNLNRGFTPGFEDPIKIQKVQRERLTPQSQKFIDFENPKDRDKIYNKTEIKRK